MQTATEKKLFLSSIQLSSLRIWWHGFMKRSFDLLAAGSGLLILSPVFAWLVWRIKREGPGPVFFRGRRSGKNGVEFAILKFRTMYENPESYAGPRVTAQGDSRVTPLGKWLRDSKLNELPQLWNVIKGEMSLVGPRPEDSEITKSWPVDVRRVILSVRPGITSPASILYRNEENLLKSQRVMDDYLKKIAPDKLRLDLLYVHNHTFLSDLDVIFWTIVALLPPLKRIPIPENQLFSGPLYNAMRRHISWFFIDSFTAFISIAIAGIILRSTGPINLGIALDLVIAIVMAFFFSLINSLLGLGKVYWHQAPASLAIDLALSDGLVTFLLILASRVLPFSPPILPELILISGILTFLGFLAVRYRDRLLTGLATRWLWHRGQATRLGERVVIVGAGECGQLAAWLLLKSSYASVFSVVGMVDDDPRKQGQIIDGYPVIGTSRTLPELIAKQNIGLVLFAIEKIETAERERILQQLRQTPARVVIIPDLLQILNNHLVPQAAETI